MDIVKRILGLMKPYRRLIFLGLFLHYHLPDAPLSGRAVALEGLSGPDAAEPPQVTG